MKLIIGIVLLVILLGSAWNNYRGLKHATAHALNKLQSTFNAATTHLLQLHNDKKTSTSDKGHNLKCPTRSLKSFNMAITRNVTAQNSRIIQQESNKLLLLR